jgi:hypothetical protein
VVQDIAGDLEADPAVTTLAASTSASMTIQAGPSTCSRWRIRPDTWAGISGASPDI